MRLRHLLICLLSLFLAPDALWAAGDDGVVVGKTADSHSVTDNGQFTYTMPVAVASGTGGMSPKLSIAYGSSSGMGLLGYGFDLHGLSTVSRAPRNLFNDGKADIIRFGATDRFTLDGRRLQEVGRTGAAVEYRTEQTAYPLVSVGCAWPVVASVTVPDGAGGRSRTLYHYTDALCHRRGRGMIGFRQVTATDVDTETISTHEYEVMSPVMVPALKSERTEMGGRLVSETSHTNTLSLARAPQDKSRWVYTCQPTRQRATAYEYNTGATLSDITTERTFDGLGNATRITVRSGKRTVRTNSLYYNDTVNWVLGRVVMSRVERSGDGQNAAIATSYTYDPKTGLLTGETYGLGNPYGFEKKYEYDAYGNVTRDIVTANGAPASRQNTTEYDARGRFKTASVDALGHRTTYEVDGKTGVVTSRTDALGNTTTCSYDSFGTLLKEKDPVGETTRTTGWSKGQPYAPQEAVWYERVERTGEAPVTTFMDCHGRTVRTVTSSGDGGSVLLTDTEYDNCGRVRNVTNPYFPKYGPLFNSSEYDKAGRLVSCRNAGGQTTRYAYDGLRTTTTDPCGGAHVRTVDTDGRLVESVDALGASVRYGYDIQDNCTVVEGPRTTVRTEFDGGGRKTRTADPDLGEVTYTHNGFGELTGRTDSKGTATYEYDQLGRLVKETRPDFEYRYTYDQAKPGLLDSKACSNGTSVEYRYDDYGRVIGETHRMGGKAFTTSTTYNAATDSVIWEATEYDEFGNAVGTHLGNGRVAATCYNPTGTVSETNVDNDLVCWYDYDGNNCLIHKYDEVRDNEEYYGYDAQDRLVTVTTQADGQDTREVNVEYDVKYYIGNLYDEARSNGRVLRQDYIYADGRLVAIHQTDDRGERMRYVHLDHLGSVWAMTDDDGALVAEYNYDPWGRRRSPETWDYYDSYEQQGAAMDRGFGGHEQLDILDMVNMGGRMYDPYMGRFLTPDPYVQAPDNTQSLNRYAYCLNNPLSLADPTGYLSMGSFFSAAVGIAVGVETFGIGSGVLGAVLSGACAGASSAFASTLMNGANFWTATKSAFVGGCWGALGGAVNYGIGEIGGGWMARVALHSVADGSMEALQGGHWEHGLMTGLVSAGGGELLSGYGSQRSDAQMLAGTAILGGVVSEIGGGKFANGAMTAAFQMMYNHFSHQGPTFKQLRKIDAIYRKSLEDYPTPQEFYRSVGLPEYDNGCAARLSYALNESDTKTIPYIKGQTRMGSDGKNYFMFAKDMRKWFHKIWGFPRVYKCNPLISLKNGIVAQYGFGSDVTGHVEYFYKGHDGFSAKYYYEEEIELKTELWKSGIR